MKHISDKALEDFKKQFTHLGISVAPMLEAYHNWMFNEMVECNHNDGWHYVNPTSWTDTEGYSKDNQACNICNVRLIYKGKIPRCLLYQEEE